MRKTRLMIQMKNTRTLLVAACAGLASVCCAMADAVPSLTWTGLAGDGKWSSSANWTSSTGTIDFTGTNDYVFCDVADATTITVPSALKFVRNVTVTNTTGATTALVITGKDFSTLSTAVFTISPTCTLQLDCPASNPWTAAYNGWTLRGGGVLKVTQERNSWGGQLYVYGSTFVLGHSGTILLGCPTTPLVLNDGGATLELSCDAWANVRSTVPGAKIKLNGHKLFNMSTAAVASERTLSAEISGGPTSELVLVGPIDKTLTTNSTMNGTYEIRNTRLALGTAAAPVTIPADSTVRLTSHGVLDLFGSQQIGLLRGEGSTAYVNVPAGTTFTVGGSDATTNSTYASRLVGAGNFVKKGANYTLSMSGDSADFSGTTTVAEGTLELKRPGVYPSDYVAYWPFDGTDCYADRIGGLKWTPYDKGILYGVSRGDGVSGDAASFVNDGVSSNHVCIAGVVNDSSWKRKLNSTNFTVSVWLKPLADDRNGAGRYGTFFTFGGWPANTEEGLCKLEYMRKGTTEKIRGYNANPEVTIPASKTLADGKWHHIAYVHSAHYISFWIDGELGGTYTNTASTLAINMGNNNMQLGNKDAWNEGHGYAGEMDELILSNSLWDETRIHQETLRARDVAEPDPLPTPAAAWTFDEDFVDEVGGLELVNGGSSTLSPVEKTGAYGKCIYLKDNNAWLQLKAGSSNPCPVGTMPFTVSLRVSYWNSSEYTHTFSFGNTYTANAYFAMGYVMSRRENSFDWNAAGTRNATYKCEDQNNFQAGPNDITWDHLVAVYNGQGLSFYRDGRLVGAKTAALNIAADSPFYVGYYPNQASGIQNSCYVDDIRIWTNCCFTADQVMTLSRTLDGRDLRGQFTNSVVTVNAGATLLSSGSGNEIKALAGSGTLDVDLSSSLAVGGGTFTGSVVGGGRLILTKDADFSAANGSGYTGCIEVKGGQTTLNGSFSQGRVWINGGQVKGAANEVSIEEGSTIAVNGASPTTPTITTSGRLILPTRLTITLSQPVDGEVIVATAGTLVMPETTEGWTLPEGYHLHNRAGKLRLVSEVGLILLVK